MTERSVQGELDGMPERLYSATPSRLGAWLDCPRRYRFAYLDRPAPQRRPGRAHTSIGTALHNALREWWQLPVRDRTPQAGTRLLDETWIGQGFRDGGQQARAKARAGREIARYLEGVDAAREPLGTERTVAFRSGGMSIWGRIDRLDEREDGRLVVVDYKTGLRPPTEDEARTSLPLALYAAGVWKMLRRRCVDVELHHVPTGQVAAWQHTDESLTRKVAEASSITRDLRAADARHAERGSAAPDFAPRPGPLCPWCDFHRHCPEGQAAGPEKSDWAGLPESDG